MAGVYMILCRPTGEFYIGGTKSRMFCIRFCNHRVQLRKHYKTPPLLQAAWDKHGEAAFDFIPLKEFPRDQVQRREAEAIQHLKPALNQFDLYQIEARARGISTSTAHARRKKGQDPFAWIGPGRPRKNPGHHYAQPIGPKRRGRPRKSM